MSARQARPSPVKSAYRHVGIGRFPVDDNPVYQAESSCICPCVGRLHLTRAEILLFRDSPRLGR